MDEDDDTPAAAAAPAAERSGPGIMALVLALAVSSALGIAGGAMLALNQVDAIAAIEKQKAKEPPPKVENALAWSEESAVLDLDPVIANLASPEETWIRLEGAIVFDRDAVKDVARLEAEVSAEILGFVRTVTMGELRGASALNHLRDDLNERVRFGTAGAVEELIIKSLVLQ